MQNVGTSPLYSKFQIPNSRFQIWNVKFGIWNLESEIFIFMIKDIKDLLNACLPIGTAEGCDFLIDKPFGWTSFDVVNKLRYRLKNVLKDKKLKVGHAGTLDPLERRALPRLERTDRR